MVPNRRRRGGLFYDQPGVVDRYLDHRRSPERSPNLAMEEPAFLAELGDLDGLRVLDLGCGDAAFADEVISRGALAYVGIDGSSEMVRVAQDRAQHPRVFVLERDIEDLPTEPASYDVITSRMALHYVDNLDDVMNRAHHALRPGGRLIFSVVHPVITSSNDHRRQPRSNHIVDRYFERGERQREWFGSPVTWFHRTIEDYVVAVDRCGLRLTSLRECEPDPTMLGDRADELERRRRVPLMLLISAVRATDRRVVA